MSVERILDQKGIPYSLKGSDALVVCFNPEHEDSNPSMRIDRETGLYHCWSCGYKGNFLEELRQPTARDKEKIRIIRENILDLRGLRTVPYPKDLNPTMLTPYRGISITTLTKFSAFRSESDFPDRIVIPITTNGALVAMVGRYENTSVSPKYLMKPKNVKAPMFPSPDLCDFSSGTMTLVEGLFDVINLHDKGLTNAVATLGTSQISRENIYDKFLPYSSMGVTEVHIVFDPDKSGKNAADKLKKLIDYNTDLVCKIHELSDDKDPGDLSRDEVLALKRTLHTM